jgi:hypothetical protein
MALENVHSFDEFSCLRLSLLFTRKSIHNIALSSVREMALGLLP